MIGTQKGTIILTTTHIVFHIEPLVAWVEILAPKFPTWRFGKYLAKGV